MQGTKKVHELKYLYSADGQRLEVDALVYSQWGGENTKYSLNIYYADARFYDAETGTWLSPDPIKDGLNWYTYCESNPTSYSDYNGKFSTIIGGTFWNGFTGWAATEVNNQVSPVLTGLNNNIRITDVAQFNFIKNVET